jgi:hypothetical protein
MIPQEYLVMYLGANAIALGLLALAFWHPRVARWLWVAIFVWAATVNTLTVVSDPIVYLAYGGLTPSAAYRQFIDGWFSTHIVPMVLSIAVGQLAIAMLLSRAGAARRLGRFGACVFLLAIAPLGVGSGFPFSLVAVASLMLIARERESTHVHASPAEPFIPRPDVRDEQEIVIPAPSDLVFFQATRLDLQSLPLVRAIFRLRGWLLGDTVRSPKKPLGIVAETMILGWGLLAHTPSRTLVMGAAARPWHRDVTFRAIDPPHFAEFAEPDYVKIVWTFEVQSLGDGRTRFRTETRVLATDAEARRKFRWYWLAFGTGIRLIRWNMLRELRREAVHRHRDLTHGHLHPAH